MSGPQFAHIQTWSRKPNPAGQSIDQIIAEATRDPEFSTHVIEPAPPRILHGNPATFASDHAAHVAARSTLVIMADGSTHTKAIRKDRHTMASIVLSYPVPRSAITSHEGRAKLAAWEKRNLEWLQEKYGSQLRVVLAHDDEPHPHIHAWLLPDDPSADATLMHPGKTAKKEAEVRAKADGMGHRESVKLGNRSLKDAMTVWQDEYHAAVGAPEGLTRSGPKRRRLSRAEWIREKIAAKAHKAAMDIAEAASTRAIAADKRVAEISARETKIRENVGLLKGIRGGQVQKETDLAARDKAVSAREAQAEIMIEAVLAEAAQVRQDRAQIDRDRVRIARIESEVVGLRRQLRAALTRVAGWIRGKVLADDMAAEAIQMVVDHRHLVQAPDPFSPPPNSGFPNQEIPEESYEDQEPGL